MMEDIMPKLVRESESLPVAVMQRIYSDVRSGVLSDEKAGDVDFQRLRLDLQPCVDNDVFNGNGGPDIPCVGEHFFCFGHRPRHVSPIPLPCSLAHGLYRSSAVSVR